MRSALKVKTIGLVTGLLFFSQVGSSLDLKEKKAMRIGKRILTLSKTSSKSSFSKIPQKPTRKAVLFNNEQVLFQRISYQVEARLKRVHDILEKSQRILRATPLSLPVRGRISSDFGPRRHPRSRDYKLHAGIDIVARFGSPVQATADGRVVFSGIREGYGKVIVIEHGQGFQTVYAHNSRLRVPVGVRVVRGQTIANVGASGHTTGTHLHYEIRKNGAPIDPRPYLNRKAPGTLQASAVSTF